MDHQPQHRGQPLSSSNRTAPSPGPERTPSPVHQMSDEELDRWLAEAEERGRLAPGSITLMVASPRTKE